MNLNTYTLCQVCCFIKNTPKIVRDKRLSDMPRYGVCKQCGKERQVFECVKENK